MQVLVRGVEHYAERGALIPEETVVLVREPDNRHDPNAVKVMRVHGDTGRQEHVGYIQAEKAAEVSNLLLAGEAVRCQVVPPLNPVQGVLNLSWSEK